MARVPTRDARRGSEASWVVGQTARQLGVSVRTYHEIKAGERSPDFATWNRICKLFG